MWTDGFILELSNIFFRVIQIMIVSQSCRPFDYAAAKQSSAKDFDTKISNCHVTWMSQSKIAVI